ncbi:cytoplasmic protein [Macrolepiota fuliginosa MF-IS2]|uniref:Cytoplasmic protein n=1 Tax=Macrolepiota fuliginosa MF-IS2 TaxID=1400762 RepID=A0A9P5X8W4_9AGAR|nr:cytoplasmic protein [Macrolepiota fuliginosa MF-IS2]
MFLPSVCRSGRALHWTATRRVSRVITPTISLWHNRGYATSKGDHESASISDSKPKPKATTTLRRSASASLPIRVNPTPTRSDIQPVYTLATAERYLLSRLRTHPDLPARSQALHDSWWVPKWVGKEGREGEIFVFSNGSYVCWGLGEEDALAFKQQVIDKAPGLQVAALRETEDEELEFVVDPIEQTRLQGDLIILGQTSPLNESSLMPTNLPPMVFPAETLLARYAYSQALSRSTALSALEVSLDDYLTSMALLPHSLEQTGKPGMGRTQLIKKLGQLMKFRQGLNLNRENFSDVPDFYWAEPDLERHFKSLSDALEVKARTASVNDKITYAAEAQSVLRQLLTESSSHRMELVIIALIAVEVVIALIRDGPELWHMLFGKDEEEKPYPAS